MPIIMLRDSRCGLVCISRTVFQNGGLPRARQPTTITRRAAENDSASSGRHDGGALSRHRAACSSSSWLASSSSSSRCCALRSPSANLSIQAQQSVLIQWRRSTQCVRTRLCCRRTTNARLLLPHPKPKQNTHNQKSVMGRLLLQTGFQTCCSSAFQMLTFVRHPGAHATQNIDPPASQAQPAERTPGKPEHASPSRRL